RLKLLPIASAHQRQCPQISSRTRLGPHPSQSVGALAGMVFIDNGAVDGMPKFDDFRRTSTFDLNALPVHIELSPRAFVAVLIRVLGIHLLYIEVHLVDSDDGESEGNPIVVTESDTRQ